jgi:hypothetical protein
VRGPEGGAVELGEVCGEGVERAQQPGPQVRAEGAGHQGDRPQGVVVQGRRDLLRHPPVGVVPGDVLGAEVGDGLHGGAGGEPAEQVGGPREGGAVPRARVGVDGLQPEAGRRVVDVVHAVHPREGQAGWQPPGQVGPVPPAAPRARAGRPPACSRRCSGTCWNCGVRVQDCTTLTKKAYGSSPSGCRARPRTQ